MSKDKESIQVTIRVRPISEKELQEDTRTCLWVDEDTHSIQMNTDKDKKYAFDCVCDKNSQQDMFEKVGKKSTEYCMEGYNCTIFAYGQTGAGKTFTMMGVNPEHQRYHEMRGLVPRTLEYLFSCIESEIREKGVQYLIKCSFVEIYNEQVIDLLNRNSNNLSIREDLKKGVYIEGVSEETITCSNDAMEILKKGSKGRHVGSTFYNQSSSRSHSVFTMEIQSQYRKHGVKTRKNRHFHFIDLAGSQRTQKSYGDRLKEGCSINKSLHVLSNVIRSLSQVSEGKAKYVNYRDSKLTFLLKDSLEGNSKTHLIANISPSFFSCNQTSSTLIFARKVKLIKVKKASINEDSTGNIQDMKNQIKRLKSQIIALKNGEVSVKYMNMPDKPQNKNNNGEMVQILQQYVEEELEKQTKVQQELNKLENRNEMLEKGIKKYSQNEVHLRMIVKIYEDKIIRLQNTEAFLKNRMKEMESSEQMKQIQNYFNKERENLLQENYQLKKLAESSKFIKSLLTELKIFKDQDSKQSDLQMIIDKNNHFLVQIKESINKIEPIKQNEETPQIQQFQEMKKKNQSLLEQMQKLNIQIIEVKQNLEESENLLKQSIHIQISLEQKAKLEAEGKKKLQEKLQQDEKQKSNIIRKHEESYQKLQKRNNELQIEIDQQGILISQLQNDLSLQKQKNHFQETSMKEKIQTLQSKNSEFEKIIKEKTEQIHSVKSELINIQNDFEKVKDELQNDTKNKQEKVFELEERITLLNNQKSELKNKIQQIYTSMEVEKQEKDRQIEEIIKKLGQSKDEIKEITHELSKEKQMNSHLKEKNETLCEQFKEQKVRFENKNQQLMSLIEKSKISDSETSQKFSQLQLEMIKLQDQHNQQEKSFKKELENSKNKYELLAIELNEALEDKEELKNDLEKIKIDNGVFEEKLKKNSDQLNLSKRKIKQYEQEIHSLQENLKMITEHYDKLKYKEKQLKTVMNQQKNQIYALKKNFEVEMQSQKQIYKQKCEDYASFQREHHRSKENLQKSLKQVNKQLQIKEQLYISNEESIKKTMGALLISKENKISELTCTNENLSHKLKQITEIYQQLQEQKKVLQENLSSEQIKNSKLECQLELLKKEFEIINEEKEKIEQDHAKQMEILEIRNNQQIDEKNAQIQQYLLKIEEIEEQIGDMKNEVSHKEKIIEELNKNIIFEKEKAQDNQKHIEDKKIEAQKILSLQLEELEKKQVEIQRLRQSLSQKQENIEGLLSKIDKIERDIESESLLFKSEYSSQVELLSERQRELQQLKSKLANEAENREKIEKSNQMIIEEVMMYSEKDNSEAKFDASCSGIKLKLRKISENSRFLNEENQNLTLENNNQHQIIEDLQKKIQTITSDYYLKNQQLVQKHEEQIRETERHNELLVEIKNENQQLLVHNEQNNEQLKAKSRQVIYLSEKLGQVEEELISKQEQLQKERRKSQSAELNSHKIQISLKEYKKILERVTQEQETLKKEYEYLNNEKIDSVRHKEETVIMLQKQLNSEKQKVEELKQFIENQNAQKANFSREREELVSHLQYSKNELEQIRSGMSQREEQMREQINQLASELNKKEKEEDSWRKCIGQWEKSLNQAESRIKNLKRQSSKEKQINKNFRGLIDNAECQINQLKLQLSEKEISYKKLLEKVSRNQYKGIGSTQQQRLSQMLEKSRIELVELKKMHEDQRKINKALKLQLAQKEQSITILKEKAEEFCKNQQKQIGYIQSDYLKLQQQHQRAEKIIAEQKQQLYSFKTSSSRSTLKIEELQETCRKLNRDIIELHKENQQIKKDSLKTGMDEKEKVYMNRIKQDNMLLKRELDKTKQQLMRESEEKVKLKAEKRYGREGSSSDLNKDLEKKSTELKHLQDIISQICNILQIRHEGSKSSIRSNLNVAIRNLLKDNYTSKEKINELEEEVSRKDEKLHLMTKVRASSSYRHTQQLQKDTLTKQIRTKLTQPSTLQSILQSKGEDKSILRMKDQNKNNYWQMDKY